ncbi:hypothetical protein VKT23_015178 [Stygiomarasmius scandens]|uniref:O-methyltransferase n=1 Tax=Marasmiellus scandens TaxID=2682957 RepID=A0ABR1J0J8_9AGAR
MSTMPKQIPQVYKETSLEDWTRSDHYHNSFLIPSDNDEEANILEKALKNSSDSGLPDIAVTKAQGKFLNLLAKSLGAKKILEVGTLGGYSTIWLGRALPEDGELITLEINEKHAKVAEENLSLAGLSSKCKLILGPAHDSMVKMDPQIPFDFIFIDADKPSNPKYFTEAKRLVKPGGVIVRLPSLSSPIKLLCIIFQRLSTTLYDMVVLQTQTFRTPISKGSGVCCGC